MLTLLKLLSIPLHFLHMPPSISLSYSTYNVAQTPLHQMKVKRVRYFIYKIQKLNDH